MKIIELIKALGVCILAAITGAVWFSVGGSIGYYGGLIMIYTFAIMAALLIITFVISMWIDIIKDTIHGARKVIGWIQRA